MEYLNIHILKHFRLKHFHDPFIFNYIPVTHYFFKIFSTFLADLELSSILLHNPSRCVSLHITYVLKFNIQTPHIRTCDSMR
jgi:hypothetical protein